MDKLLGTADSSAPAGNPFMQMMYQYFQEILKKKPQPGQVPQSGLSLPGTTPQPGTPQGAFAAPTSPSKPPAGNPGLPVINHAPGIEIRTPHQHTAGTTGPPIVTPYRR